MRPTATAPPHSALTEPVSRTLLALLRRAVLDHADRERRRVFVPVVHVGTPGGSEAVLPLGDQRLDHALRTDVIQAMWRRTHGAPDPGSSGLPETPCLVWLTRPGSLETRDIDLAWLRATHRAASELGRPIPMVVVNRRSWRDPVTGVRRDWTRMRHPRDQSG
jgi:hypothetical protein